MPSLRERAQGDAVLDDALQTALAKADGYA